MLRKILPAPIIFLLVVGFTFGLDYSKAAQARTTSTLTTPSEAAKKHVGTEQTIKKPQNTSKEKHKATVAKKKTNKNASIAKKKTKDKHIVNSASHKKQNAAIAKNKAKKSHIAKKGKHKKQTHVIAKNKNRKKAHLARHKNKHKHHHYAKKSKVNNNADAFVAGNESTKADPVDLWLAKDAPEKFRQGTNDEELDRLTLNILESAFSYLGAPYRYGGTSPDGFDCSGFVRHVFSENGISLGRSSRDQALEGRPVSLYDLKPGDLIFFNMRNRRRHIDHVGLYIGKGQFIHASSTQSREIKIEELDTNRYLPRVVEARRVLEYTR